TRWSNEAHFVAVRVSGSAHLQTCRQTLRIVCSLGLDGSNRPIAKTTRLTQKKHHPDEARAAGDPRSPVIRRRSILSRRLALFREEFSDLQSAVPQPRADLASSLNACAGRGMPASGPMYEAAGVRV